jgi:hypothetical protein
MIWELQPWHEFVTPAFTSADASTDAAEVRLGLDVGASRIKAVLAWPDGTATKVMFGEASPLDAAVVVDRRGRVRAGSAAERAARDVAGVVPYPLLLADAPVQVGAISVSALELLAAPLRHPWSTRPRRHKYGQPCRASQTVGRCWRGFDTTYVGPRQVDPVEVGQDADRSCQRAPGSSQRMATTSPPGGLAAPTRGP